MSKRNVRLFRACKLESAAAAAAAAGSVCRSNPQECSDQQGTSEKSGSKSSSRSRGDLSQHFASDRYERAKYRIPFPPRMNMSILEPRGSSPLCKLASASCNLHISLEPLKTQNSSPRGQDGRHTFDLPDRLVTLLDHHEHYPDNKLMQTTHRKDWGRDSGVGRLATCDSQRSGKDVSVFQLFLLFPGRPAPETLIYHHQPNTGFSSATHLHPTRTQLSNPFRHRGKPHTGSSNGTR